MKRIVVLLGMLLLLGGQAFGQAWPVQTPEDKPVMFISHLKGKAYVRRREELFTIEAFDCDLRAKANMRPVRLAIVSNDAFWLDKGATAEVCSLTEGNSLMKRPHFTANQTIGKGYTEKERRYKINYALTPALNKQFSMLAGSAANSKPLTDLSRPGVVLPMDDGLVRASVIPYWFWEAEGVKTAQVAVVYELNDGEIDLGQWQTNGKPQGTVAVDRAALVKKLRAHYGRDEGWADKPIAVMLRLTDNKGKRYAQRILLENDANSNATAGKLAMLAQTLREAPGDARDFKVSEQVAGIEEFQSEALYLLAQAKSNATHAMLITVVGEYAGIEPKALIAAPKRN